ncbi:MAG TPA: hypothetical protein VGH86_09915 [Phenylobacterium sp.]|jgi:hypothetical protein
MRLWILLIGGCTFLLVVCAWLLLLAMNRSERRARRALYRSLGMSDVTIDELMGRNGDVSQELEAFRERRVTSDETQP